ncbi:MAG: hypothetical protein HGA87_02785 [Desulfobulbaceae bacterium]|nr:hypothetical protein [Desulfobulbaceae bacterium]
MSGSELRKFWESILSNLRAYLFSGFFGAILTVALFCLTAPPSGGIRIRKQLANTIVERMAKISHSRAFSIRVEKTISEPLDIDNKNSIVLIGTSYSNDKNRKKFIAIFDPQPMGILDKLVGRDGCFKLTSLTIIPIESEELEVPIVEPIDMDADGFREVHMELKDYWADMTSVSPLIYKKMDDGYWQLIAMPSMTKVLKKALAGERPNPQFAPTGSPIFLFSDKNKISKRDLKSLDLKDPKLWEQEHFVFHNGHYFKLYSLSNGGNYYIKHHPIKGYFQIGVICFFDDAAVLDDHFAMVQFLRLGDNKLKVDTLWNWGYPMLSAKPYKMENFSVDDFEEAGISAHTIGRTFYGYTDWVKY